MSLLLDNGKSAEEIQLGAGCPHELLGVPLGVYLLSEPVVDPSKSHDGTLEPIYLVQEVVHVVFPVHLDQHPGAHDQTQPHRQEGLLAAV